MFWIFTFVLVLTSITADCHCSKDFSWITIQILTTRVVWITCKQRVWAQVLLKLGSQRPGNRFQECKDSPVKTYKLHEYGALVSVFCLYGKRHSLCSWSCRWSPGQTCLLSCTRFPPTRWRSPFPGLGWSCAAREGDPAGKPNTIKYWHLSSRQLLLQIIPPHPHYPPLYVLFHYVHKASLSLSLLSDSSIFDILSPIYPLSLLFASLSYNPV